jgi:hypothetical protein
MVRQEAELKASESMILQKQAESLPNLKNK